MLDFSSASPGEVIGSVKGPPPPLLEKWGGQTSVLTIELISIEELSTSVPELLICNRLVLNKTNA